MHLSVVLCDDDAKAREYYAGLIDIIGKQEGWNIDLRLFSSAKQMLFELEDARSFPDIIFQDVFMEGVNGLDASKRLAAMGFDGEMIILSVSDESVFGAFDAGAFNYVIKRENARDQNRFDRVFYSAVKKVMHSRRKFIMLNNISEHRNIPIDTIHYFEVQKSCITVHYNRSDTFEFFSSLGKVENTLMPYGFVRSHRAFLVAVSFIASYTYGELTLRDGTKLPLGRSYRNGLKTAMETGAVVLDDPVIAELSKA
jgi:DNA-binding LytR/AlgR family response regulator